MNSKAWWVQGGFTNDINIYKSAVPPRGEALAFLVLMMIVVLWNDYQSFHWAKA